MQALDRTAPMLPMMPAVPHRQTHTYVRHGTTSLFAALDIVSGTVISQHQRRHRHQEFLRFLKTIDKNTPAALDLHLICDNYATHKTPEINKWLAAHPRFTLHFTPTSASWLNLVERWFAELTNRKLRRSAHRSVTELETDVEAWIAAWNDNPKPFVWTKTANEILDNLANYCTQILATRTSNSGHWNRRSNAKGWSTRCNAGAIRGRMLEVRWKSHEGGARTMRYLAAAAGLSAVVVVAPVALAAVSSGVPPGTPWTMHTIVEGAPGSGQYAGSDGVDLADVNRDGRLDVVSGYEQGHRVSVSLHPGRAAVRDPWRKTVKLPGSGRILGPEDAVFADVDADGATDVIVGAEADRRVTILFAPTDPGVDDRNLLDALQWQRVDVAASLAVNMATMRVQWADMNGDGAKDILAGGKETSSLAASVGYYTSANPRDGGSWIYHSVTPAGWVMQMLAVDLNNDGRLDIVYSDRDPINIVPPGQPVDGSRRGLRWLQNPGGSSQDWIPHPVSPVEPHHKWFGIVDWDADGDLDVVDCRSEANVHQAAIWLNGGNSLSWTRAGIPIPGNVGWCQHATVADVDGVGGKDVAFSYSHAGDVSGVDDLSGVVWLKNTGTPGAPSWERHEIGGQGPGIKYDNLLWTDLDQDGDLDALTSEQHEDTDGNGALGPGLGVIWYENPQKV